MALLNHRPVWALTIAAPLLAMVSTASYAQTWKINLRDADLTAFINEVADITGKNFAVDPRVRGNVTVISMLFVWGGLVLSILHLMKNPEELDDVLEEVKDQHTL